MNALAVSDVFFHFSVLPPLPNSQSPIPNPQTLFYSWVNLGVPPGTTRPTSLL